jgi:hypothetical protein
MYRSTATSKLRDCEPELRAAGITRLSIFGSVVCGDASPESDVDLMAEFDPARQFSLLDLVGLENRISDILGARVELTSEKAVKERIREHVQHEAVLIDTKVLVRILAEDDTRQLARVRQFLDRSRTARQIVWISSVVLCEAGCVLASMKNARAASGGAPLFRTMQGGLAQPTGKFG